jgi:hypothetical protein
MVSGLEFLYVEWNPNANFGIEVPDAASCSDQVFASEELFHQLNSVEVITNRAVTDWRVGALIRFLITTYRDKILLHSASPY